MPPTGGDTAMTELARAADYVHLCALARDCRLCPRMGACTAVLGEANGPLDARVMFVAEAPGRHGADRTRVPLNGDQAGGNFEDLLGTIGWQRSHVFVTNAVLCNPRDELGRNATPTIDEVRNCADLLAATIDLVEPSLVVTLGAVALRALHAIEAHEIDLGGQVATVVPWGSTYVFPLYHTASRARVHRGRARQVRDFFALKEAVDLGTGRLRQARGATRPRLRAGPFDPTKMQQVLLYLLQRLGQASWFRLSKLLYLIDYANLQASGALLTEGFYINQKEGPWATVFGTRTRELLERGLLAGGVAARTLRLAGDAHHLAALLHPDEARTADDVLARYSRLTDAELKSRVYLTRPMKRLLRRERAGELTHNAPVFADDARDCRSA